MPDLPGDSFIAALKAAIAPRTIVNTYGNKDGVKFVLSDKSSLLAKRETIKGLRTAEELDTYVKQVAG